MSDDVEKCEDNVYSNQYNKRDWDGNSSSGGSVYQDIHGRIEETVYSTDDEFMDATETIRSPLLSGDPEDHISLPVLKQLRQEKEQTRYIVVDMLTDSESVNNFAEHCKQTFETVVELPSGENDSICCKKKPDSTKGSEETPNSVSVTSEHQTLGTKSEKSKFARTLRLPSSGALPTVKPDRPARGDARPQGGISKIPLPKSSATKLQQISTTSEQKGSEPESCQIKPSKQPRSKRKSLSPTKIPEKDKPMESEDNPGCLNQMDTPASVPCHHPGPLKPPITETAPVIIDEKPSRQNVESPTKTSTRPASRASNKSPVTKDDIIETENVIMDSSKEGPIKEEPCNPPSSPEEQIISRNEERIFPMKFRTKRSRSENKSNQAKEDSLIQIDTSPGNSTNEGVDTKRMRVSNQQPSREELEKPHTKVTESAKNSERRKREIEAVRLRLAKDRLNLMNSREKDEESSKQSQMETQDILKSDSIHKPVLKRSDTNTISQNLPKVRASSSSVASERNTRTSLSPRHLSPLVMNMSIVEKRKQLRQSREVVNAEHNQKTSSKNPNMPEIKPSLFKPNQLKNQLGQKQQESVPHTPMKSSLNDESLKKKSTLVEKRKQMMKQKEATNSKTVDGEAIAQRSCKSLGQGSREKQPSNATQKRSNLDIRKRSPGAPKSSEKNTSFQSSFTMPEVLEEFPFVDVLAKPSTTSTNLKVTLTSMQNVYKMHCKRCEDHLNEVKRAKDKLGASLDKLEGLRLQVMQKFGEEAEEFVPPLNAAQCVVQNTPTIMTTTTGMNTEGLEEVAESLFLMGNNQQLKQDIEDLRMQLEEAKEIGYSNKKEDDVIQDLTQRIREMSLTLTLAEKRQQTLEDKMEEKQKEIISLSNDNRQMNDLFRQRTQELSALRKQIEDKNKELETVNKRFTEASNTLQEELYKNEMHQMEYQKLLDEKLEIEKELKEMDGRFGDFEERELCLNTILENEKKKNKKLEDLLIKRDEDLNKMEKKLFEMEASSSNNLEVVAEQLLEKDSVIRELDALRATQQAHIRDLCCLISDMFAIRGIEYNTDYIHTTLSSGSLPLLREELVKLMEEHIEENNKALNEARSKIIELQNQVKILQIELEDSKMISNRLTNVISHQKTWETDRTWEENQRPWSSDMASARQSMHTNVIENSNRENRSFRDGDVHTIMPARTNSMVCSEATMARNNFNELFVLLERKRRQLLQLERKYQDMEEVHSHCAQKRTRNETRIAQLEMMLATYQG